MTMKNDGKFEEDLTCQFKVDMRNLANFDLSPEKSKKFRVRMIVSHFANCEVNSTYCDYKVVNHTKIAKNFSQGKFNSSKLYFSILHPYFFQLLHTIIKTNIGYAQNYTTECRKCFGILKLFQKNFRLWRGECVITLSIFIAKWISSDNLNAEICTLMGCF